MYKDFVTYGNTVVAFCVFQAITTLVSACTNQDFRGVMERNRDRVMRIAVTWGIIYSLIVISCFVCEAILRRSAKQGALVLTLSTLVFVARLVLIWVAQWVYSFVLDGIRRF